MTKRLHFNLTESATRTTLLDTILSSLSSDEKEDFERLKQRIRIPEGHNHNLAQLEQTIALATVEDTIKEHALNIYRILAEAEAASHECSVEETHFHEVGNEQAVLNTLHMCAAVELLSPDEITASSVQVGSGTINCAHGELDIPAPATREVLKRGVPVCETRLPGELCTPTSAAFIYHYVDTFIVD